MSVITTNYTANVYNTINNSVNQTKTTATSTNVEKIKQDSVVEEYKRKHPESASHVDKQVRAGRSVKLKNGAQNIATENMTMEEYKKYFYGLLDTIPYDPTRINDETILTITDAGWEQMKKDPDYESWVLGYFVEDRAVRNPFFGWGNDSGSFITEHFGASIEEHHGEGYSKSILNNKSKRNDEESWWLKRHKRIKAFVKDQAIKARKESNAKSEVLQQEYIRQQYEGKQRLHSFLTTGSQTNEPYTTKENPSAVSAVVVYDSLIDLFTQEINLK